jgi:hypothetical protein
LSPILFFVFIIERALKMRALIGMSKSERDDIITIWSNGTYLVFYWIRNISTMIFYAYGM